MRFSLVIVMLTILALFSAAPVAMASDAQQPAVTAADLKVDATQPYIVKKGDTLWDIADHFFKDPWKWMKIWERNLYITNPDLIYPGNEIWFDGRSSAGGLTTVKPQPGVIIKPVERLEGALDASIMMTALMRQDFIQPDQIEGVGHVLGSLDDRLNFAAHDRIYLKLKQPAKAGTLFDLFRTADNVVDPATGEALGVLVEHLGQVRITSQEDGTYRGKIERAFTEIARGDRLKPARDPNLKIVPQAAEKPLNGSILYIRDDGREAAQNQVVGISLGITDGIQAGTVLSLYQQGRIVGDVVSDEDVRLPKEKVGELIVLVPQQQASLAVITKSTAPIHIGDAVLSNGQ